MTAPTHQCLNGRHCQPGDDPRTTETPNTLCDPCRTRACSHIRRLPRQYLGLQAMIGEHTPTPGDGGRRNKPESAVLINTAIDTLCGRIHHYVTLGAEIVADTLNIGNPYHHRADEQVYACCRLLAPNLGRLLAVTVIDIMAWNVTGTTIIITTTTGPAIIQELDHLAMKAHFTLGQTRQRTYRDLPCARCNQRTVGRWAGADSFDCETCGALFAESDIRRRDRILLERHRLGLIHA